MHFYSAVTFSGFEFVTLAPSIREAYSFISRYCVTDRNDFIIYIQLQPQQSLKAGLEVAEYA